MKIYKRLLKAFGGCALYIDKSMLSALNVKAGDEIIIDVSEGKITLTKPNLSTERIAELLKKAE